MTKKHHTILAFALATLMVGAAGCNPDDPVQLDDQVSVTLDPALSQTEKNLLASDLNTLLNYKFEMGSEGGALFEKIFGGQTSLSVVTGYLHDRVKYVVPESAELRNRLLVAVPSGSGPLPGVLRDSQRAYRMAANIGMALWLQAELARPQVLAFAVGQQPVVLDSSRVGIMQLGEGYTKKKAFGGYKFPAIQRIATFIHEARHSDCTGGISEAELAALARGETIPSHSCGHRHVVCPEGHELAGLPACDAHAWGAYSVEAIFTLALAKACTSCSEKDKNLAVAAYFDAISRVLVAKDMLAGRLGAPDMSSSGLHP
jgi:hypothetical protein